MKSKKTRERILDVSLELFNKRKASNVSTVQISAAMSISPGNLYYYYANKEDVIRCLWEERMEGILDGLLAKMDNVKSADDILDFIEETLKYMIDYRFFYTELSTLFVNDEKLVDIYRDIEKKQREAFTNFVIRLTEEGKFIKEDEVSKVLAIQNAVAVAKNMLDRFDVYTDKGISPEEFIGYSWIRIISVMESIFVDDMKNDIKEKLAARGYNKEKYLKVAE